MAERKCTLNIVCIYVGIVKRDFKENRAYYISLKRQWQIQNMRWLRSSSLYVTLQRVIVPAPLRTSGILANTYQKQVSMQ